MDLSFSPTEEAFRQEVKDFICENFTPDMREVLKKSPTSYLDPGRQRIWQKSLYKKGGQRRNGRLSTGVQVGLRQSIISTRRKLPRRVLRGREGGGRGAGEQLRGDHPLEEARGAYRPAIVQELPSNGEADMAANVARVAGSSRGNQSLLPTVSSEYSWFCVFASTPTIR